MFPATVLRPARARIILIASLSLGFTVVLSGCGIGSVTHSTTVSASIHGRVHGGQQPVGGSTIQLYAAGTSGNGSSASGMLTKAVTTQTDGTFDITGDYTCSHADDQVYLVATGGNPGLAPHSNNPALVMMAAFGSCDKLPDATYIEINEVTTAAAAWALAPFLRSAALLGASSSNAQGLADAFLHAQLLADSSTGLAATLPANLSVETDKLYALADALAPCVNSTGTTGCTPLFTAATVLGNPPPSNTLSAALNITQHPGQNVAAVFAAINAQAPFPTGLKGAPHDWTMSMTVTGDGLAAPTALAVDAFNNVWVADYQGGLSAFSAQGTPLSNTAYGTGVLSEVFGLVVDKNNNIWATNEQNPHHAPSEGSITGFHGAASSTPGSLLNGKSYVYDTSMDFPFALAADSNGDILVVNNANSSVTVYTDQGIFVKGSFGNGDLSLPVFAAVDASHGLWVANNGDGSVTHLSSTGSQLSRALKCCKGANGVALDETGNAWIANFYGGSVTELGADGTTKVSNLMGGGMTNNAPTAIVLDAAQDVWVANFYGANFSQVTESSGTHTGGSVASPGTGYGLDANLLLPFAIAPDAGGNLWISNYGNSTLTMFFGMAEPTVTPLGPVPTAP